MLFRPGRAPDALRPRTSRPAAHQGVALPPLEPAAEVLRARRHLLGLFLLLGLTVSSWLSRLPTVRTQLDLSTGELGTVMLLGALGSLLTVLGAGAVVARWGSTRTILVSAVVFSAGYLLMGLGPTLGLVSVFAVGIVLMSMAFALGNVPLNVETVVVERRMGRTVVPQFHAAFSVGAVLGSGLGAAAAWAAVPVVVQFGAVGLVALVWRLASVPRAVLPPLPSLAGPAGPAGVAAGSPPAPERRGGGWRTSLRAWRERRTLLIGVIVMSAALSEGSANNWLAIAVVDGFEQTEAVAAIVFGTFVASMTIARLVGTWLIDRFGRFAVLAGSGALSLAGLGIFALAPSLPLSVVGVVAWGLGAGLVIPIGMAAVSGDPLSAAGRVAVVSAFASVASIAAPPLIGLAAEAMGTRHALLLIAVVMLAGVLLSGSIREGGEVGASAPRRADPLAAPEPADLVEADIDLDGLLEPARRELVAEGCR